MNGVSTAGVWRQVGAGLRLTLDDPVARALAGSAGVFTLCGNMLGVVLLLYLVREVHLAAGLLGVIFGVGGGSAFAGALVAERATRRWGIGRVVIGGLAIYTRIALLLPLACGPAKQAAGRPRSRPAPPLRAPDANARARVPHELAGPP